MDMAILTNDSSFNKQKRSKINLAIHKKEFSMVQGRALLALINTIDEVIIDSGSFDSDGYSLCFDELDSNDSQKIVAAFIQYDDRDLFSIYENEKRDEIVDSLLTMLKKDTPDADEDFIQTLKSNLVAYYASRAQELIDERCVEVESNESYQYRRPIHSELRGTI
jgi:hypothetical protein